MNPDARSATASPRRVCLLSGGGDAPALNAVIRGFVHAAHRLSIDVVGSRYGLEGLVEPDGLVPLSIESVRGILPRGGSMLGCSTATNPFAYAVDGAPPRDLGPDIVARLSRRSVDALVLAGGDGTLHAAQRFAALGMPCIVVPKTIDNDLGGTDQACGFDTAVATATRAVDALHSTAEAHRRVMIVEVMGRYAGWIALRAGIAGGADVVLLPELPYRVGRVVAKIHERAALGLRFSIVVIGEGARPVGGSPDEVESGRPGHLPRLGGAGERLMRALRDQDLGHEVRLTVLGHLQRGGSPSAFDRALGTRLGVYAAQLCREGRFGCMVALRGTRLEAVPLDAALADRHAVDPSGEWANAARAVGIELGDDVPAAG
jgi:phosphofructokinase-like protein